MLFLPFGNLRSDGQKLQSMCIHSAHLSVWHTALICISSQPSRASAGVRIARLKRSTSCVAKSKMAVGMPWQICTRLGARTLLGAPGRTTRSKDATSLLFLQLRIWLWQQQRSSPQCEAFLVSLSSKIQMRLIIDEFHGFVPLAITSFVRERKGRHKLLLGWRRSLVGWRPSLSGWRRSLLGWRPLIIAISLEVHQTDR